MLALLPLVQGAPPTRPPWTDEFGGFPEELDPRMNPLVGIAAVAAPVVLLSLVAVLWRRRKARKMTESARLAREVAVVVALAQRARQETNAARRRALERSLQGRLAGLVGGAGERRRVPGGPKLDRMYRVLARALVQSPEVNLTLGRQRAATRLGPLSRTILSYGATFRLLSEAEASVESDLYRRLPDSGRRALLMVYFHSLEEYMSRRLRVLIPRGATLLLGERGHINLRRRGWEAKWTALSLGNLVYLANENRHFFIADDFRWNREVEPRLRQAVDARNHTAHPGWSPPSIDLVRTLVYGSLASLESVLKRPLGQDRVAPPAAVGAPLRPAAVLPGGGSRAR